MIGKVGRLFVSTWASLGLETVYDGVDDEKNVWLVICVRCQFVYNAGISSVWLFVCFLAHLFVSVLACFCFNRIIKCSCLLCRVKSARASV